MGWGASARSTRVRPAVYNVPDRHHVHGPGAAQVAGPGHTAIGVCAFATLLLGVYPEPFIQIAKSSLLMLGGM